MDLTFEGDKSKRDWLNMVGKSNKDYRRWEYEDEETEMNVEETLSLEENDEHGEEMMGSNSTTTFVQPNLTTALSSSSRTHHHFAHHKRLASGRRSRVSPISKRKPFNTQCKVNGLS